MENEASEVKAACSTMSTLTATETIKMNRVEETGPESVYAFGAKRLAFEELHSWI